MTNLCIRPQTFNAPQTEMLVGTAVVVAQLTASDTTGPGFESSHRQLLLNILTANCKDENKKRPI